MKNGKVDIVENEASKFWNEKIQRLEEENKTLKERFNCVERQRDSVCDVIKKLQKENKKLKEELMKIKTTD